MDFVFVLRGVKSRATGPRLPGSSSAPQASSRHTTPWISHAWAQGSSNGRHLVYPIISKNDENIFVNLNKMRLGLLRSNGKLQVLSAHIQNASMADLSLEYMHLKYTHFSDAAYRVG